MSFNFTKVNYFTVSTIGDPLARPLTPAIAQINYNKIVLNPPSTAKGYKLSVEKMTLPLQSLPLQEAKVFQYFEKGSNILTPAEIAGEQKTYLPAIFSITDFLRHINDSAIKDFFKLRLTHSGILKYLRGIKSSNEWMWMNEAFVNLLDFPDFFKTNSVVSENVRWYAIPGEFGGAVPLMYSESVIFDRIDQLKRIVLLGRNLQTESENDNKGVSKEITTIDFSGDYTISEQMPLTDDAETNNKYFDMSFSPRQDLILSPNYSRYIDMNSHSPIQNINIEARAFCFDLQTNSIKYKPIYLKPGSVFMVKIAFWEIE